MRESCGGCADVALLDTAQDGRGKAGVVAPCACSIAVRMGACGSVEIRSSAHGGRTLVRALGNSCAHATMLYCVLCAVVSGPP